ncbi:MULTISPECIES: ZIP family metal transporter [unclassified Clostridium]|jgi:ZIP family zinc transporter|uniref:ZIP family metal transporter n=1 Tax=Clostridium TaxID=1485 RepID=UPI0018A9569B|nr:MULTISPECIES: ZIP family metal transporter [unclassified Clostridium]MBX9136636.1 ZIP family metal transporter [Clostridium sp. K12(2020)]MBX9144830.1 ZIP family metal transporter [Clostridium sp. K13]MDU2290567.1 ZIP family metal transporter [Clostridium celatum]MDU4325886.1 ZIP family metal transporter [Clostridium celatum]
MNTLIGILIPLLGTTLGAACVFFIKKELNQLVSKCLLGFASGVMIAASVWSLIIPAIDMSSNMNKLAFLPAAIGVLVGIIFMLILDKLIPHIHLDNDKPEGMKSERLRKTTMLVLAVVLHNIPEGMAVGIVFAGAMNTGEAITIAGAFALSIGIAIQNFPEGAIISLPLKSEGVSKGKSFLYGFASGIVEPIGALLTIIFSKALTPMMPYFLSFAAGAMIYVVVEELIPEASKGEHSNISTIGFAIGFVVMMILDVALG